MFSCQACKCWSPTPKQWEKQELLLFCFLFLRKQTVGVPDMQSYTKNVTKPQVLGLTSHHLQKWSTGRGARAAFSLWAPLSRRLLFRGDCRSNGIFILENFFICPLLTRLCVCGKVAFYKANICMPCVLERFSFLFPCISAGKFISVALGFSPNTNDNDNAF